MNNVSDILVLTPYGVFPPRTGGHHAILEPARRIARSGVEVAIWSTGIRRFEVLRRLTPFSRAIEANLTEHRHLSVWHWLDLLRRRRPGLPPFRAGELLNRADPPQLREAFRSADAVLYETPWLFPYAPYRKPRVFIAHNAEYRLTASCGGLSQAVLNELDRIEGQAWRESDLAICFTEEDRRGLSGRYGPRPAHVVPIGVDVEGMRPGSEAEKAQARLRLGISEKFVVLFAGSGHLPNRRIMPLLQAWSASVSEPDFLFVAAGSVSPRRRSASGLLATGPLPDMTPWYRAADCCINPVVTGSGMNVKTLEYMAWGLPVVTTGVGARGIAMADGEHALVCGIDSFVEALRRMRGDPGLRRRLSSNGRALVEETYAAEKVAQRRFALVESLVEKRGSSPLPAAKRETAA